METILDHSLSQEERDIFLKERSLSEEELLRRSEDFQLHLLADLFWGRGEGARAKSYLSRIGDPAYAQACREMLYAFSD